MAAVLVVLSGQRNRRQQPPDDQLSERSGYLPVGLKVRLDVLTHSESDVSVIDPLAQGLPVDLGVPARCGVAVAHVVQVDQREIRSCRQPLETG